MIENCFMFTVHFLRPIHDLFGDHPPSKLLCEGIQKVFLCVRCRRLFCKLFRALDSPMTSSPCTLQMSWAISAALLASMKSEEGQVSKALRFTSCIFHF
ncbi:hypothetical protein TNIN_194681 [Trichonephila inaurata madagascariensis]|uniref:Uncharacterized protein n=1 Tax=Trichonephila inaurata madagascariensis TaxID=2747483 RepID=A0A8X6Y1G6_9ARAC|nr:hypothetical protein TNIN_194681 [Trichonephila inaurata madagascariensis]